MLLFTMDRSMTMAPNSCSLENLFFDPFSTEYILLGYNSDPDKQFFNDRTTFTIPNIFDLMRLMRFLKRTRTIIFLYFALTLDLYRKILTPLQYYNHN